MNRKEQKLIKIIKNNDIERFDNALNDVESVNFTDSFNKSPLCYALENNQPYMVEKLIDKGSEAKVSTLVNFDILQYRANKIKKMLKKRYKVFNFKVVK